MVESNDQIELHYKDSIGWKETWSTPYALEAVEGDLDSYIASYTEFYLANVVDGETFLGQIFNCANRQQTVSRSSDLCSVNITTFQDTLVWLALKLWTAHSLLMKGWEIDKCQTLGMRKITHKDSSLYGTTPAPRVMQNQLDSCLETRIAETELALLKELEKAMLRRSEHSRIAIFIAVVITLHSRERDIWRLEGWLLNQDAVGNLHISRFSKITDKSQVLSMATS